MNENKKGNGLLTAIVIILAVALVASCAVTAVVLFGNNSQKEQLSMLQEKVDELSKKDEKETEADNETQEETVSEQNETAQEEKDYEDIILDGSYCYEGSDYGISFTKDGRVSDSGLSFVHKGTYRTISKNLIEICMTECQDINPETGESSDFYEIEIYSYCELGDDEKLYFLTSDENYGLIKYR